MYTHSWCFNALHQDFSFLMVYWFSLDPSHFSHICSQHCTRSCTWPSHETTSSCWSWENFILVSVKNRVHLAQGEWALLAGWLATIHSWSQPCLWDYATRGNWMWHNALLLLLVVGNTYCEKILWEKAGTKTKRSQENIDKKVPLRETKYSNDGTITL